MDARLRNNIVFSNSPRRNLVLLGHRGPTGTAEMADPTLFVLNRVLGSVSLLVLLSSMSSYLQPRRLQSSCSAEAKGLSRITGCTKGAEDWMGVPWRTDTWALLCREMVAQQCWSPQNRVRASPFRPLPALNPLGYIPTKQQSLQNDTGVRLFMIHFQCKCSTISGHLWTDLQSLWSTRGIYYQAKDPDITWRSWDIWLPVWIGKNHRSRSNWSLYVVFKTPVSKRLSTAFLRGSAGSWKTDVSGPWARRIAVIYEEVFRERHTLQIT